MEEMVQNFKPTATQWSEGGVIVAWQGIKPPTIASPTIASPTGLAVQVRDIAIVHAHRQDDGPVLKLLQGHHFIRWNECEIRGVVVNNIYRNCVRDAVPAIIRGRVHQQRVKVRGHAVADEVDNFTTDIGRIAIASRCRHWQRKRAALRPI